jgi:hypothetical protein
MMDLLTLPPLTPLRHEGSRALTVTAGEVLSGLGITRRKVKKLDAVFSSRQPQGQKVQRAFSARPFVSTPLIRLDQVILENFEQLRENRHRTQPTGFA